MTVFFQGDESEAIELVLKSYEELCIQGSTSTRLIDFEQTVIGVMPRLGIDALLSLGEELAEDRNPITFDLTKKVFEAASKRDVGKTSYVLGRRAAKEGQPGWSKLLWRATASGHVVSAFFLYKEHLAHLRFPFAKIFKYVVSIPLAGMAAICILGAQRKHSYWRYQDMLGRRLPELDRLISPVAPPFKGMKNIRGKQ